MGYRSNVVITLSKEKSDLLQAQYVTSFPEDTMWLFDGIQEDDEKNVLYYFCDVKWYDNYPDVSFIEEFLNELDQEEYRFIRTGEEPGDIEEKGYSDAFDVRVHHQVTIDWD